MKKFEEKEYNEYGLSQFCDNQDDYGCFITIEEYEQNPDKDLEERVKNKLLFF